MTERWSSVLLALLLTLVVSIAAGISLTARADQVVVALGQPLEMDLRKGTLVRTDKPVATVFITDPSIADVQVKSPTLIYVYGKRVGETVLYGVTEEEEVVLNRVLRVNHNLNRLQAALDTFLPGATVRASSLDGALVLEGHVKNPSQSEDARRVAASFVGDPNTIINRIGVTGPNQVNLRIKIAEISRNVIKQLGINWETVLSQGSNFFFGLGTGRDFLTSGSSEFLRSDSGDSAFLSFVNGDQNLNILIDALDDEGLASILAEPNLTAMSGETARFLAGGEFPVPVSQDEDTITISFKEFGVALAFTPTILGDDRINLRVSPEVSQLSTQGAVQTDGFDIPALTTRRAQTTIELGSGQSFAIAGLLQNNVIEDVRKFPWLGDLPVIGRLFRSESFRREETELVIIATPYIVRPVSSDQIAIPNDGFVEPDDHQRTFDGHLYEQQPGVDQGQPAQPHGRTLAGHGGFIVE